MKELHTFEEITSGIQTVTLADLIKVAKKNNIDPSKVRVSVSDSRWTQYRDLILSVIQPKTDRKVVDSYIKQVKLSKKDKELMKSYFSFDAR